MRNQKKTEIKVGATVVAGLIILIWIFGWAKNFDPFSERKSLTIRFESVAGLEIGDRIMLKGVRKGYVEDIYTENNQVYVVALLDDDVDLREDANFAIMMLDLMGGKKIETHPGISDIPIDYDKIQNGKFFGDISTVMASLSSVETDIIDVIHQIKISLNSLNEMLGEGQFASDLKNTLTGIDRLTGQISALVDDNSQGISDLVNNSNRLSISAYEVIEENRELINSTLTDLSELVERTQTLTAKIDKLTGETLSGENNLGKLMYDENMLKEMVELLTLTRDLIKISLEQIKGEGLNVNTSIF